jgi:hypothetical protein
VLLGENDPLWVSYRHLFIPLEPAVLKITPLREAMTKVVEDFNAFMRENKMAGLQKGEVQDLAQMSAAMKSMPEYKQMTEKVEAPPAA